MFRTLSYADALAEFEGVSTIFDMTKRSRYALLVFGLVVVLLLFFQTPLMSVARATAWRGWVGLVGRWGGFGPLTLEKSVEDQLLELRAENIRLQAELRDYNQIRSQIDSASFDGFAKIYTALSARPTDTFHTQYILNRGVRDGVVLGAPVVVHGSVLIGFVVELHETTSVLQLIFHPETSIPVDVLTEEETGQALARGTAFTGLALDSLPHTVPIRLGDAVVTAGQDAIIPHGLLVGEISAISSEEHEPYQQARLTTSFTAHRLAAAVILVPL